MLSGSLARLAHAVTARPRLTLALALAVCGVMSLGALKFDLVTRMTALVSAANPAVQRFEVLEDVFGATDLLFVAVEDRNPDAEDRDTLRDRQRSIIQELAEQVTRWEWDPPGPDPRELMISHLEGTPDRAMERAFQDQVLPMSWLLLPDDGLEHVVRRLEPRRVAKRLVNPAAGGVLPEIQDRDPVGLWSDVYHPFWTDTVAGELPLRRDDGYLISRELTTKTGDIQAAGRYMVLVLHPRRQSQDTAFGSDLMERMTALEASIEAANPELDLHVIGGYPIANRDYHFVMDSALVTLLTSLAGVLLLFAIAYRSLRLPLMIMLCLIPAVIATLGLASITVGKLTALSSGFAAVLIGLGVDFAIHLYSGYGWSLDRLSHLASPADRAACRQLRREAAIDAMRRVGPGILAGALTSIGAFGTLMLADYRGLAEMGAICSIGLTILLLMLLVAVPAFLVLAGPLKVKPSHLLKPLGRSLVARPRLWGAGLAILLVGSTLTLAIADPAIAFDRNPRNLRPAEDAFYRHQTGFAENLGLRTSGHQILISGDNEAAVMRAGARINQKIERARPDIPITLTDGLNAGRHPIGTTLRVSGLTAAREAGILVDGRSDLDHPDDTTWRVRIIDDSTLELINPAVLDADLPAGTERSLASFVAQGVTTLSWFPGPDRQHAVLEQLSNDIDWDGLDQTFADANPTLTERSAAFIADLTAMRERVTTQQALLPSDLLDGPIGGLVQQVYREANGMSYLRIPMDLRHREGDLNLVAIFAAIGLSGPDDPSVSLEGIPGVTIGGAGVPSMTHAIQEGLIEDFNRMAWYGAIAVMLILLVVMHRVGDGFKAVATLAGGLVASLAVMIPLGVEWNLMNIAALPLILGIGIDNGIHFVHALRRRPGGDQELIEVITETGHPLLITAATSVIGFGSLMLNAFRGIQSFGEVVVVGILGCLVVALIGQPLMALMSSHSSRRNRTGHHSDPPESGRFHASALWPSVDGTSATTDAPSPESDQRSST